MKNFPSPIVICIAAVIVNLIGSALVRNFDLPLYLDTSGTIFIAMISGYVPGVAVGFATNLLNSFVNESEMYYCSISIFVALYVTFLARRGIFETLPKTLLAIFPLALITTFLDVFIERFLFCTGVVEALNEIQMTFPTIFLRELCDKSLLILLMFVAIKFVPPHVKEVFRALGRRQAPLTAQMRRAVYQRKCPTVSLRTRVLLMLMLSALFIAVSISFISYRIFEQAAFATHVKIAESLVTIAAEEINPARVDDYVKFRHAAPDYDAVEKKLRVIQSESDNIKFLRVCKITPEGWQTIFGADSIEENFSHDVIHPYPDDFIAGKDIPPTIVDFAGDKVLVVCKAVRDSEGNCQCYVAADFSVDLIANYGRTFIAHVIALFSGCFIFVFVIGTRFIENNIILPVNTMEYCANNFAYDSEEFCANNVEQIKRLKIHTGDEIENLYNALLKTTQDVLDYFEKLRQADRKVAEMDELAHTDSLTGIKNKAAYDETIRELDKKISDAVAKFSIVMVDVNYLKRVNDTYGHERGNEYLINAAKLICAVFGAENVYRIGGDEFVVILEGDKVSLVKYFVTQFVTEMNRKNSGKRLQPWEKVSAAVGTSNFESGVDKNADEVFKRADAQMYENKLAMKAARTD